MKDRTWFFKLAAARSFNEQDHNSVMKTKAPYFVLVLFVGLMFYAGCGGGGTTSTPTPSPTPTPTPSSVCSNPSPGTAPAARNFFILVTTPAAFTALAWTLLLAI